MKKINGNTKLSQLLALEDSPEKLELLIKKQSRLYEGRNLWICEAEIKRLKEIYTEKGE